MLPVCGIRLIIPQIRSFPFAQMPPGKSREQIVMICLPRHSRNCTWALGSPPPRFSRYCIDLQSTQKVHMRRHNVQNPALRSLGNPHFPYCHYRQLLLEFFPWNHTCEKKNTYPALIQGVQVKAIINDCRVKALHKHNTWLCKCAITNPWFKAKSMLPKVPCTYHCNRVYMGDSNVTLPKALLQREHYMGPALEMLWPALANLGRGIQNCVVSVCTGASENAKK